MQTTWYRLAFINLESVVSIVTVLLVLYPTFCPGTLNAFSTVLSIS